MSKEATTENKSNQEKAEELINKSRDDLKQMQGYIVGELVKIGQASENKKIDVNDVRVKDAVNSLIYSEPDNNKDPTVVVKPVLSINATTQDIQKNISKFIKNNPEYTNYFDKLQEEIKALPKKIENQYSTQEGIDIAVIKRLKDKVVLPAVDLAKLDNGKLTFFPSNEREVIYEKIGQSIEMPSNLVTPLLRDRKLLDPLRNTIMKHARMCFGEKTQSAEGICLIDINKLESKENIDKFNKLVNQDMQAFSAIQENPEEMKEQGSSIIANFAPLLESSNPALKRVLAELNPGYLTEHGWGESIALELQRVAKPKLWQRIVSAITGTDYAQKNIDKAVANFEKSNSLYIV
ncbi:hypothetical protein [Rickettsia tamurae]|uniref:hypothetical protein n=1 Tax=Rickettsia tamurae TaxID=334545 RepID=UPI000A97B131|nr:hypothetical protein [Rickettsia tamurae]